MKTNKRYLSWILAMLMVLPMLLQVAPVAAADTSSWESADYADLPEVDQEILERFLKTDLAAEGFSAKGNLNFGAEINFDMGDMEGMDDEDLEGFEMEPIVIAANGEMDITSAKNQNLALLGKLNISMYGMEQPMDFVIYIVDHPEDADKLRVVGVVHTGEDDEYLDEEVDRSDIEETMSSAQATLTVDDFNKVADLRLIEDQGDKIHAVMLVHPQAAVDQGKEALEKSGDKETAEELLDDFDDLTQAFAELPEALGFEDMVIPIEVVIEKESGKLVSMHFNGMGLQQALAALMMGDMGSDESVDFKLNNFTMELTDVTIGVDGPITVPDDVQQDIDAHSDEVQDNIDFSEFESEVEDDIEGDIEDEMDLGD